MSRRPDIVIPPGTSPEIRQVLAALAQRIRALEDDAALKEDLARAGVIRIDSSGTMSAVVRPQDARNNQR